MIVVADASPLSILIRVDQAPILEPLFGHVLIPPAVEQELRHERAPQVLRDWMANAPPWLEVRAPHTIDQTIGCGLGETEAISLAMEINAETLLVDDLKARRMALARGVRIIGTIGVLEAAAERNLVDLADSIKRIRQTNFAISEHLLQNALDRQTARRERMGLGGA